MTPLNAARRALLVVALAAPLPATAAAQEGRTVALTRELGSLLDERKLDAIAARDPEDTEKFVAALYFPGVQLLVVSAKYSAPSLLNEKIILGNYRDAYLDVSSASIPDTKIFIEDMRADGLRPERQGDEPSDTVTMGTKASVVLDGDYKAKKLSEAEYSKMYTGVETAYERMLSTLIAQLRKPS